MCDSVSFTVGVGGILCDSNDIVFNNTSFYNNTVYYDWDIPSLSSASYNYNTWGDIHAWDYPNGTYPATLNVYSDAALTNLIGSVTHSFTVNTFSSNINANFSYNVVSSNCDSSQVQLTDLSQVNPITWYWYWTDVNGQYQTSTLQNPIITLGPGNNNVYLSVQDSSCYADTSQFIVISGGSLTANIQDSIISQDCDSTSIQFYGYDVNATSYSWVFSNGQTSTLADPVNTFLSADLPGFALLTTTDGTCTATDSLYISLGTNNSFTATVSVTDSTCSYICDNTITVTPTGGQAPYSYSLNNGVSTSNNVFNNLCPGSYYVEVVDLNGCVYNTTTVIDTVSGIMVDITSLGSSCDSLGFFMAEANASGGSGSYFYLWSNGSTSSILFGGSALSYSVIVTDSVSGCTASASTPTAQNCYSISGTVYIDYNGNCIVDGSDVPLSQSYIVDLENNVGTALGFSDFVTFSDNGQYLIDNLPANDYYFDVNGFGISAYTQSCTGTSVVVDANNPNPVVNLFMTPISTTPVQDLSISMHTIWNVSPGQTNKIKVRYCNDGTIIMDGSVEVNFDMALNYNYSTPSEDVLDLVTNTTTYNFTGLQAGQCRNIYLNLTTPTTLAIFTPVDYNATVYPISGDVTPSNNIAYMFDTCSASWDPNDKSVYPAGNILPEVKDLSYHINFQNEGNANATLVIVRDDLDDNLDISTLRNVSASHNFVMTTENTDELVFTFNNIQLTPKDVDEPNSKGHIDFTISQKEDLPLGTVIENTAEIYFDFNPAIVTNTTVTTIVEKSTAIGELDILEDINVYPNPSKGLFNISLENENNLKTIEVFDVLGKKVFEAIDLKGYTALVNLQNTSNGVYLLKVLTENGTATERIVITK